MLFCSKISMFSDGFSKGKHPVKDSSGTDFSMMCIFYEKNICWNRTLADLRSRLPHAWYKEKIFSLACKIAEVWVIKVTA